VIINSVDINNPDVTICTVNYNGLDYLKNCFDSIQKSKYPSEKIETIMVDNASVDSSVDYARTNYPWVKIQALDRNYGFANGNNIGVKNARGKYIVFLNNDTAVTPDWLDNLVDVMESNRDIGIAGSKILLYDTPEKINSAGANITFIGVGYDIGFLDNDSEEYNIAGSRGCVCAAAMIVRRDEFLRFGGFDEDYFMYFEDTDLCWRYWLYGKRVEYIPESVIYHKFGGTSGHDRHAPMRVFYGTRNALFNIIKNYEVRNISIAIAVSIPYHILKTVYFLARLEFAPAFSMIKAYCSFIKHLPDILTKRAVIQRERIVTDSFLFKNSIILPISAAFKEFIRLLKM
jgi:GT2 family glycosyltransferase